MNYFLPMLSGRTFQMVKNDGFTTITLKGPDYRAMINKTADLIFAINSVVLYLIIYYSMLQDIIGEEYYLIGFSIIRYNKNRYKNQVY